MKFYELLYIARSDLTTAQLDDLNNNITNIIKGVISGATDINNEAKSTNLNNKVDKIDSWGIKTLAYKSKNLKRNKGTYCIITFYLDNPEVLKELNNRLRLNESILRFIIKKTNTTTSNLKPSVVKKNNTASVA